MAGLIPSSETLGAWISVQDAWQWSGLQEQAWRAVARQLGDPDLEELVVVASLDGPSVLAAVQEAAPEGRPLNPIMKAKAMLTINAIRAKFQQPPLAPPAIPTEAPSNIDIAALVSSASREAQAT